MTVQIKRAYESAQSSDGYRVLVDRIWPRGVSKEQLGLDEWIKEISPSTDLRKWFGHDPDKFTEFKKRYKQELKKSGAIDSLTELSNKHKTLTLVYGAKDEKHNNAVVLKEILGDK